MKIFLKVIAVFIIIAISFLASFNTHTLVDLTLWQISGTKAVAYQIPLIYVILATLFAGILAGIFWAMAAYLPGKAKLKEYQRKLEKTSVQSSEESSKIAVLEAKIVTLEKALKAALEKNE